MEFKVKDDYSRDLERQAILTFLGLFDAETLAQEALSTMGWGEGDPISAALKIMREKAEQW